MHFFIGGGSGKVQKEFPELFAAFSNLIGLSPPSPASDDFDRDGKEGAKVAAEEREGEICGFLDRKLTFHPYP